MRKRTLRPSQPIDGIAAPVAANVRACRYGYGYGYGGHRVALAVLLSCLGLLAAAPVAAASATIEGNVTNAIAGPEDGKDVANIEVTAYEASTGDAVDSGAPVLTGPLGVYKLTVPSGGDYLIGFKAPFEHPADFAPQFFPEESTLAAAHPVIVAESSTTSPVDAKLTEGASITGTVTDRDTHQPLGDVAAYALSTVQPEGFGSLAITNASGEYTLLGLPSGNVHLAFFSETLNASEGKYLPQIYNDQPLLEETFAPVELALLGTSVAVSAPNTTSGINAALVLREPVNVSAPVASGTLTVGQTLTCASGSWTGMASLSYAHQWLRDGVAIGGATASTYVIQAADQGHGLACQDTATNKLASVSATSNTLNVPPAVVVPITGPAPQPVVTLSGSTLLLSRGSSEVHVSCKDAACSGSLEAIERVTLKRRVDKKTVSKSEIIVLAKGSYTLAAGHSTTFVLRLTPAGKTALAKARRHRLTGALRASVTGGKTAEKSPVLIEISLAHSHK
jgi:hypothetical protein